MFRKENRADDIEIMRLLASGKKPKQIINGSSITQWDITNTITRLKIMFAAATTLQLVKILVEKGLI